MGNGGSGARAQGLAAQRGGTGAKATSGAGAAKSGGAKSGAAKAPKAGSLAAIHASAQAWQAEHGIHEAEIVLGRGQMASADQLVQVAAIGADTLGIKFDDGTKSGTAQWAMDLREMYGASQLGLALYGRSTDVIRQAASNVLDTVPAKASRAQLISLVTAKLTNNHFDATNVRKAAATTSGTRTVKTDHGAQAGVSRAKPAAPRKELIPVAAMGAAYNRDDTPNAYSLQQLYGNHQLRDALAPYGLASLKTMAAEVQARNPGTKPTKSSSKAGVTDYIVKQLGAE